MQADLRHSHFSDRFKQYYGREFTQIDKRNLLALIANKEYKKYRSYYDKDIRLCLRYDQKHLIIVLSKDDGTFITCYPAVERFRGVAVQ